MPLYQTESVYTMTEQIGREVFHHEFMVMELVF